MSLARTSPSLRSRIVASRSPLVTIPGGRSGVRPPEPESYTERYRGTEYDSRCARPSGPAGEPLLSDGRLMVIMSAALTVVSAAGLAVILG